MSERDDMYDDLTLAERFRLRWWGLRAWLHRCPECHHRPDRHHDSIGPRWEDDRVAQMLGVAQYGCRRCGAWSIEERDGVA